MAPPPGPSAASGLGTIFVTLGVLVAVAIVAIVGIPYFLGQRGKKETPASSEPTTKKSPKEPEKKTARQPSFLPILATDPVLGTEEARVTIVEFDDLQCPFCGRAQTTIHELVIKYGDKLRIVWKDNPLPFHANARPAAKTARIAYLGGGDGAFWSVADQAFAHQSSIAADLESWGKTAGVDKTSIARFEAYADKQIDEGIALAKEIGATGTPTFYIDGELLSGAQPRPKFEAIIDEHLKEAAEQIAMGTKGPDVYAALVEKHYVEKATAPSSVYAVDVTGAPTWGDADALVTVVVFGDLAKPKAPSMITLRALTLLPDTRVVFRDRPSTPAGREAAAVVRAIGDHAGETARLDALEELWSPGFIIDASTLSALGSKHGIAPAIISSAISGAATDPRLDADLDRGDDVSVTTTPTVFLNGEMSAGMDKTAVLALHATAKKRAEKLVTSGTPKADVYAKLIKGGLMTGRKHATLSVPTWAPTRGPATAPIVIQVFADFQCPFCARAMTGDFGSVVTAHASEVKVVYRHDTLPFHTFAEPAAQMSMEAMSEKGVAGFWRVHDALYAATKTTGGLTLAKIDAVAVAEGLNMTKVHAAQSTHKFKKEIDADVADAAKAGMSGTPTFLVGDEIVVGAVPAATFEAAIRRQKAKLVSPTLPP